MGWENYAGNEADSSNQLVSTFRKFTKRGKLAGPKFLVSIAVLLALLVLGFVVVSSSESNDLSLDGFTPAVEELPGTTLTPPQAPEIVQSADAPTVIPDVARNTNVDVRNQFLNTPSAQIPVSEFLSPAGGGGRTNITLGCTAANKCLGQFRTQCTFSHFGYDDPIVFPGEKGAAHLHMFFGNTLADHNSTGESLLNSGLSTCNGLEGNRTAYWAPAVFDQQGNVRIPNNIIVYYKSHGGAGKHASINDFPEDFKMIGGSHLGGNNPALVEWHCARGVVGTNADIYNRQQTIPNCQPGHALEGHIFMPQCIRDDWSADDSWAEAKDKLTNAVGIKWSGNCPANHTKVPLIEVFIAYETDNQDGTEGWFLSSDVPAGATGGETLHADWYGGWNRDLFNRILGNCITRVAECSWDLVDNGEVLTRVNHYGPKHEVAFTGGPDGDYKVSAEEISKALCPGDEFTRTEDAAMCESSGTLHNH